MKFLNAIGACLILVGTLNLCGHLAGQLREGFETPESLIIGGGCLAFGILLSALAAIGMKLDRIERRLSGTHKDESESLVE